MPFLVECVDDRIYGPYGDSETWGLKSGTVYTVIGEYVDPVPGWGPDGKRTNVTCYSLAEVWNPFVCEGGFNELRFKRLQDSRIASLKSLLNPSPAKTLEPA